MNDRITLEALTFKAASLDLIEDEAELYRTKHWDYRFDHPATATEKFVEAYKEAYRRALVRRTDMDLANDKVLTRNGLFKLTARQIAGLWKGRQAADRIGCPYDFYCEQVMRFADKVHMSKLPSPIRLCETEIPLWLKDKVTDFSETMVGHVVTKWLERTQRTVSYASHPAYLVENFCEGTEQVAYLDYLFERVRASTIPEGIIATLLDKQQITPGQVEYVFKRTGKELVARAARLRSVAPIVH